MPIYQKGTNFTKIQDIYLCTGASAFSRICKVYLCIGANDFKLVYDGCAAECDCDTFCSSHCDDTSIGDLFCDCQIHRTSVVGGGGFGTPFCCCGEDGVNGCDCDGVAGSYFTGSFVAGKCYANDRCLNSDNYPTSPSTPGYCWKECCGTYPTSSSCPHFFDTDEMEHFESCCYEQLYTGGSVSMNPGLSCP
jgi:hypothetical protein